MFSGMSERTPATPAMTYGTSSSGNREQRRVTPIRTRRMAFTHRPHTKLRLHPMLRHHSRSRTYHMPRLHHNSRLHHRSRLHPRSRLHRRSNRPAVNARSRLETSPVSGPHTRNYPRPRFSRKIKVTSSGHSRRESMIRQLTGYHSW